MSRPGYRADADERYALAYAATAITYWPDETLTAHDVEMLWILWRLAEDRS